jgi:HK97 family phage portal protein
MNINPFSLFKKKSMVNTFDEGALNKSWGMEWWQQGKNGGSNAQNAVVEACVQRIATAIASMPIQHFNIDENGVRKRVLNSNPLKVLRDPNPMMNQVEFLHNGIRSLYMNGNMYAYCVRNNRTEITQMWLLNSNTVHAYRVPETGDVVYSVGDTRYTPETFDPEYFVPARDMLHIKLATGYDPLRGESPISSAAPQIAANNSIAIKSQRFFENQGIPSGVLQTDLQLSKEQVNRLRDAWNEQSQGLSAGRTPILAGGLKWQQVTMSSQDAQLVQANTMSIQAITGVFGVPLPLVNSMESATYSNTETLISHWLSTGLGFTISLIETAFERIFECSSDEHIDLDEKVLLRANFKDRLEAIGTAIGKGVFSPNEGRQLEGLPPVEGGEKPYLQQQMIQIGSIPQMPAPVAAPVAPAAEETKEDSNESEGDQVDLAETKALLKSILIGKMRHA